MRTDPFLLTDEVKDAMWTGCGVVRDRAGLDRAADRLDRVRERLEAVGVPPDRRFNRAWQEYLDVRNQVAVARSVVLGAQLREETRGAHARADFPDRDDATWLRQVVQRQARRRFARARAPAGRPEPHLTRGGRFVTAAQALFVAGFVAVNVVVAGTVVVVLRGARAVDGGAWPGRGVLARLARLPAERAEANRWAHLAHRVSGVAIFAFLVLHLLDVSLYALSPARFDEVHALYGTPVMRVFECGLLLALLFHALNGLRLVAVDLLRPRRPRRDPRAGRGGRGVAGRHGRGVGRDPRPGPDGRCVRWRSSAPQSVRRGCTGAPAT